MKLVYNDWRIACDQPLALMSVESDLINSIRWYKAKGRDLPFLILRRFSNVHDPGYCPCDEDPVYRFDRKKITDSLEYDIVQCARALFKDIEDVMKKTANPRFGVFNDLSMVTGKAPHIFDYIDGGLFLVWSEDDKYSERHVVECQIMIASDRSLSEMWSDLPTIPKERSYDQTKRTTT